MALMAGADTVEEPRPSFIPNVTAHDLWETYLPQYRLGFSSKDLDGKPAGGAMGTMCSCECAFVATYRPPSLVALASALDRPTLSARLNHGFRNGLSMMADNA
eukprot:SAG22_NODE_173_length_16589_cov_120.738933_6_plen_103_part_00